MLQLQNKTPFAANISVLPDEYGVDTLYVITSARFNIGSQWTLAKEQTLPTEADEYDGEPGTSSLKYPSEYHLGKQATDIIMLGDCYAPGGQSVSQLDVSLSVGNIKKTVRVFGDRVWQNGYPGPAESFVSMPLNYERAYGGLCVDQNENILSSETRNPIGCGYLGEYKVAEFEGLPVPNIEDPNKLISHIQDTHTPQGFGAIAPNWQPRVMYAGTYDESWSTTRAPYLPADFDKRFFNCAHPDLIYPGFLVGGEPVSISNMHSGGELTFQLPTVFLSARARIKDTLTQLTFNLETLLLKPNDLQIGMTWRAAIPCGKSLTDVVGVELSFARSQEAA